MNEQGIGINDIGIYIPKAKLDLQTLARKRVEDNPRLERHLDRAARVTGQQAIRFPSVWEDTATMAATSAYRLLANRHNVNLPYLRHIAVGTESGLDHSKPVSSFVEGMLRQAGVAIPNTTTSFQVQHACAAGTLSMLSVASLLAVGGDPRETGLVICSDIARYQTQTTAEITQGAGSVSMLLGSDPDLIELDLATQGYYSSDVDDFFRPLGSKTAKVKGTYSMSCYKESLEQAFTDHCKRRGESPEDVLKETDYVVMHTPFRNLPETAMKGLLATHLGLDSEESATYLEEKGLNDGIDAVSEVGNIYTGAMYLALAFTLSRQYAKLGNDIVGKRILFASYGSGNIMTVFSGRIAERAPDVISKWDLESILEDGREATIEEYEQWVDGPYSPTGYNINPGQTDAAGPLFTLEAIREDGYREYGFQSAVADAETKSKTPLHLYRSA